LVEAKDVTVNVLTSAVTTLVIIFLLIPMLKIPVPAVREVETIETKKYYYPYVTPVALEGDYSTWTIYDSFDDADVYPATLNQWAIGNKEESVFLLADTGFSAVRTYMIATKTLSLPVVNYSFPAVSTEEGTEISVLGRYVCGYRYVGGVAVGIGIWKNGDLIQSFSEAGLGLTANNVYSVSISRSGKYIFVSGKRVATGNVGWVVLVGS
jgi:hypothetical protein